MIGEERLAIILAGEESEDLRSLTRQITGEDTPGQFCAILGKTTMLEETWRRVALAFPSERTLTVVTRRHSGFYKRLVSGTKPKRIIVQPHSRGMAPAILYALFRLQDISGNATLAIFPSHHYVEDDAAFMRHVEFALEGARARPDLVVLLGAMPDCPETDYCWIEMGDRVPEYLRLAYVRALSERPSHRGAVLRWQLGWLWNSSVIVARIPALLSLMREVCPQLYTSFDSLYAMTSANVETEAVEALYAAIGEQDFWREVATRSPMNLAVLPVAGVEWSDLSRPRRVLEIMRRTGIEAKWFYNLREGTFSVGSRDRAGVKHRDG